MTPMTIWLKGISKVWPFTIYTNNFALEVKVVLGLESTHLESWVAKIGLNGPPDY